jgi:hypothetical protein
MTLHPSAERTPWLDAVALERLERHLSRGLRRLRHGDGTRLISVTTRVADS